MVIKREMGYICILDFFLVEIEIIELFGVERGVRYKEVRGKGIEVFWRKDFS